ncbi:MAG TPA: hypothetical protein VMS92_06820, partial [Mycobacterium sp.]|nr:hypothetical protein [Mycobacterium sp.]
MSDFVGGLASRRVAALRVVLVSYPIALVLLAALATIVGGPVTQGAVFWGALCGVSQALGVWWFYAALGSGPISVVSPLTAILVAGIPVGAGLVMGERPSVIAGVGVVLVSYPIALVLLAGLAVIVGGHVTQGAVFWGALCGVSQALGVWWFYAALGAGPISVVSPLTAILVAAIPVGAGLAMGERPGVIAGSGVVLALIAVVLVSREATDEDVTPHKFTATVAWLTVGSGVAFGLNLVLIAQAPAEANLWP